VNGTSDRQTYTASSGQTVFAATYDTGYIDVYLNGVKLVAGTDFTATNGTSITLASGATINDVIDIVAYGTFVLADHYDSTASDARYVQVAGDTMTGNLSFGDNNKAIFGAGSDLQIYHDATTSYIRNINNNNLMIAGSDLFLKSNDLGQTYFHAVEAGAISINSITGTNLTIGGANKLQVTATGIDVTGTITADGLTVDDGEILLDSSTQAFLKLDRGADNHYALTRYYTGGTEEWRTGTFNDATDNFYIGTPTGNQLSITSGGDISFYEDTGITAKFFWDASAESLGIGTTPSAWNSLMNATQIGTAASFWGSTNTSVAAMTANAYYNSAGNYTYINTDEASQYIQVDGTHSWLNAPSGSAGTTATLTERMRIDASGNVGIGTSSPAANSLTLENKYLSFSNSQTKLGDNGIVTGAAADGNTRLEYYNGKYFTIAQSGTERMRIDSSGNLLVGTTSNYAENVQAAFYNPSNGGISLASGTSGLSRLMFADGVAGTAGAYVGSIIYSHADDSMRFNVNGGTERMRINSSGNVGIGTSSPKSFSGQTHVTVNHPSGGTNVSGYSLRVADTEYSSLITYPSNSEGLRIATVTALPMTFQTNNTERMRIAADGNLLVGTTSSTGNEAIAQFKRTINGASGYFEVLNSAGGTQNAVDIVSATNAAFTPIRFWVNGYGTTLVGSITATTSSVSYNTSSDYRLKTDAQPMTGASARVLALKPVNFEWISTGTRVDGFLAHEAQEIVPECVTGTKDAMRDEEYEVTAAVYEDIIIAAVLDEEGNELEAERTEQRLVSEAVMGTRSVPDYQGIDQSKLVPLLTAALQEALNKIDAMEIRLAALENN
jgi:hypothetical protein